MTQQKRFSITKKTAVIALAVSALGASGLALACGKGGYGKGMHGGNMSHFLMKEVLDLTDSQNEQIQTIREKEKKQLRKVVEVQKNKKSMLDLSPRDPAYLQKIQELASEKSKVIAERMFEKAKVHAEIYLLLTPAQQEKMDKLRGKMKSKIYERMSHVIDV